MIIVCQGTGCLYASKLYQDTPTAGKASIEMVYLSPTANLKPDRNASAYILNRNDFITRGINDRLAREVAGFTPLPVNN